MTTPKTVGLKELIADVDSLHEAFKIQFPLLVTVETNNNTPLNNWSRFDFFTSVALGFYVLACHPEKKDKILPELVLINPLFIDALQHLTKHIENEFPDRKEPEESELASVVGFWIIWNINQNQPIDNSLNELGFRVGNFLRFLAPTYGEPLDEGEE